MERRRDKALHDERLRFFRFNAVGALSITVQMVLLTLLVRRAGIHYLTASTIAVEVSLLYSFFLHRRWTWADRFLVRGFTRTALVRFHLSSGTVSVVGNLLLMHYLVSVAGMHLLLANGVTIAVCALLNFLLADRYVFA